MTLSDYFMKHNYEGDIYKTVNLRNLSLNQYCKSDSAVKKEQKNIEKQLADFRGNLWKVPAEAPADSVKAASDSVKDAKSEAVKEEQKEEKKVQRTTKKKTEAKASSKSSGGGAPRVSVRRTRR